MSDQKPFDFDKDHPRDPEHDEFIGKVCEEIQTQTFKLYRKDGPDTSKEAAESLKNIWGMELLVFEVIKAHGPVGCISDEVVAKIPEERYQTITARYKALMEKGWIEDTGERRNGVSGRKQRVMRAK